MYIAAAAMVPVLGMVGSAIDMGRGYMAQVRLQQACDAGAIAGRRIMTGSGITPDVQAEVVKFVTANFPQGSYGSTPFSITPTNQTDDTLDLTLTSQVDTTVARIVGVKNLPIQAVCSAKDEYSNIDLMLVLDTTLSMNCASTASATTLCENETGSSKIVSLRSAVATLYDTLKPIEDRFNTETADKRKRIRWGIVPYSMNVNVGTLLRSTNTNWVQTTGSLYRNALGQAVSPSTAHDSTWFANTFDGCVEERATINSITASSSLEIATHVANGARDLDINTAPNSAVEASKWAPSDPAASSGKSGSSTKLAYSCPKRARKLDTLANKTVLTDFLNSSTPSGEKSGFVAGGYTYLDIGLLWGARLMSSTGLWSSENPTVYHDYPVQKHVIFMTDGFMDPDVNAYTAYGIHKWDKRVANDASENAAKISHDRRVQIICNAIKDSGARIWVVAFGSSAGTAVSSQLKSCSSGDGYWFWAGDSTGLNQAFQTIGNNIGSLRLSK